MKKIFFDISKVDKELKQSLVLIKDFAFKDLYSRKNALRINFIKQGNDLTIKKTNNEVNIYYACINHALRGLGIVSGKIKKNTPIENVSEKQDFKLINIMLDTSRNAVMKPSKVKELLIRISLMGVNSLMLYNETTYEVPGEPYWGYNLGKYSIKELNDLSCFADKLGIEMFPCIQTLAHVKRALQWPCYRKIKDTETVMKVGTKETYDFIEKTIKAATKPFKSKKIHIGMDEALDLGLGHFLKENGHQSPYKMMNYHLKEVLKITRKYNLEPMMWADMYFRAGSKTGQYHDLDVKITNSIKKNIPQDVKLIYWDYYHKDKKSYDILIEKHKELNPSVGMANGAQTWNRFWANYSLAFETINKSMNSCRLKKVKDVFLTVWGNDGNECDFYSALPVFQYFADNAYSSTKRRNNFEDNLFGSCDIVFSEWEPAGNIDNPINRIPSGDLGNISKFLLWEDPLFGVLQPMVSHLKLPDSYRKMFRDMGKFIKRKRTYNNKLKLPMQLAKVLSVKSDFPSRLESAYKNDHIKELENLVGHDIKFMKLEIKKLWKIHRAMWFENNKPNGWETLDTRYGGLILRLETVSLRINDYLNNKVDEIEELENKKLILYSEKNKIKHINYEGAYTGMLTPVN